jgi:hypothetical protein
VECLLPFGSECFVVPPAVLSRDVEVKICKITILPFVLYGCETWSLTLREEYSRQTMRWSLRGVNILSAVRGEYRARRWTEDFLLVSSKVT